MRLLDAILYPLLFALFLNLSFNINFSKNKLWYGGEFWSDKGGYYIYLPATFIYGFHASAYPDSLDYKNGRGFRLNKDADKMMTKYTFGVSFFVLPFFLPAHFIATQFDLQPDGFSMIYHRMAAVACVFYLILSMFILKSFLLYYFPRWLSYSLPFIILLSTNLYFYGLDDVMMSHLYSFFLISLYLLVFKTYLVRQMKSVGLLIALGFVLAFLVLIRPTNILLVLILVFWDAGSRKEIGYRIRHFLRVKPILIFLVAFLLVFFPQFIYWHYISGNWIFYTYQGETFTFWNSPMIIPFWFSPLNGLFPYTPAAILFVTGFIVMIARKYPNGVLLLLLFLFYSYLFSSWENWYFGGSFGCRVMVEFYALFSLAMGYFILFFMQRRNLLLKLIPIILVAGCIQFNQQLFYRKTFYAGGTWSWEDYKDQLRKAELIEFTRTDYTYKNDFENRCMYFGYPTAFEPVHSGTISTYVNMNELYHCTYERVLNKILDTGKVSRVSVSVWIDPVDSVITGAGFFCRIEDFKRHEIVSRRYPIDDFLTHAGEWAEVRFTFPVPDTLDGNQILRFYLENTCRTRFYIDDLVIHFE